MYLGSAMQEAIDSGKVKGKNLDEAIKKQNILLEASEFINEIFYKYEEMVNSTRAANYELAVSRAKLKELEGIEKQLEATKKAWENE